MSSLDKVFDLLEAVLTHQDQGLTFSETVAKTGIPKASAHRHLKELVARGYLTFSPETKRYKGSLKLATLGSEVMANFDLRDHAHPYLLKMQRELGHTCNMGIKNGDQGIYVDKIESQDYGIKLFSEVGKTFPLYCTGLGKVLLAWSSEAEVEKALAKPLKAFTENTVTNRAVFKKQLEKVRRQGLAEDREEITRGIMCLAAPVFGVDGRLICAISITFPTYVESDRGIEREVEALKRYAVAIGGNINKDL
jgi:DNA-binding IclR family transcriptional regulator